MSIPQNIMHSFQPMLQHCNPRVSTSPMPLFTTRFIAPFTLWNRTDMKIIGNNIQFGTNIIEMSGHFSSIQTIIYLSKSSMQIRNYRGRAGFPHWLVTFDPKDFLHEVQFSAAIGAANIPAKSQLLERETRPFSPKYQWKRLVLYRSSCIKRNTSPKLFIGQ